MACGAVSCRDEMQHELSILNPASSSLACQISESSARGDKGRPSAKAYRYLKHIYGPAADAATGHGHQVDSSRIMVGEVSANVLICLICFIGL